MPAQLRTDQPTLPAPAFATAAPPDAEGTAAAFLDAWQKGDYAGMHTLLAPAAAQALGAAEFAERYRAALDNGSVVGVEATVLSALQQGAEAQVQYKVVLHTGLVGSVSRQITMQLVFADSRWGIVWDDGLILPELKDGGNLLMEYASPARGNIYDRSGLAFAAQTDAVAIGVVAGEILPDQEGLLLSELSRLLNVHPEALRSRYAEAGPDWYVALGEASIEQVSSRFGVLNNISGLRLNQYQTRYYMGGVAGAPHAVGYVAPIPAAEVAAYQAQGYSPDAFVGAQGLEKWGEKQLAGERGGTLWVRTASGALNTKLAEKRAGPAQAITTTLDRKLQREVQAALQGMTGAAVVVNFTTGEVLAMASSPAFDPNLFDPSNYNISELSVTLNDPLRPLINRATQGQYPPGSVFKVVTLSAALESKLFVKDQTYYCGYEWTELGADFIKYDWTYEKQVPESGTLDMVGALRRSCNPWFYHMGFSLHRWADYYLPDMARSFGFGPPTGIVGLTQAANEEVGGVVPSADWAAQSNTDWTIGDSVNMAIGQGDLTVTPLQLVMAYSALANGGQLLRPQLVLQMAAPGAEPTYKFEPQTVGAVPLSPETLATVCERAVSHHKLQRCHRQVALPDGHIYTVANRPIRIGLRRPVRAGHHATHFFICGLAKPHNPGCRPKAKTARHIRQVVIRPPVQAVAHMIKPRIARAPQRTHHVKRAALRNLLLVSPVVFHKIHAQLRPLIAAVVGLILHKQLGLECRRKRDYLEGRARRVLALRYTVDERPQRIIERQRQL